MTINEMNKCIYILHNALKLSKKPYLKYLKNIYNNFNK